jgi:hypothetical protein
MTGESARERPTVVYVMGAGHSGSTILGVALGNCSDFFYAGEVEEWLVKSGRPPWGEDERTRFWDAVADRVDGSDLFGDRANRYVERSAAVLRVDRWVARVRLLGRYRRVAEDLLAAISQVAGARHVVDTSHFPLRARELRQLGGVDVFLVYLVRDAQGVVASNLREISPHEVAERRLRILRMNANLWLTQLVSLIVFLRQPRARRVFLRHEEFLADPEGVLEQLLERIGSAAAVPDLSSLRIGSPIEGNRLIRSQRIALQRSSSAGSKPDEPTRLTLLLELPWRPLLSRLRPVVSARSPAEHGATVRRR